MDYDSLPSIRAAFGGQDAVVSCITTFATQQQRAIIDAAVAAKVKRFVPSEYGMDSTNVRGHELMPPLGTKRQQVEYLQSKENEGLSWTALIVGAFFDWAIANGFAGYDFENKTAQKYDSGEQHYEATNVGRIAEAVVKILERPQLTKNEYVFVHSFNVKPNQVLAEIERVTGNVKWKVEQVNLENMYKVGRQTMSNTELNSGAAMCIHALLMGYRSDLGLNDWNEKAQEWGQKLGLEDEDLRMSVERIVKDIESKV